MELLKRVGILILFTIACFSLAKVFFLGTYPDFSVYYNGSVLFLQGKNPYIFSPNSFSNYVYPPFVLLFFLPFTLVSLKSAAILFTASSVAALFFGVYFCLRTLRKMKLFPYLFIVSLCALAFPTKFTLGMGQINLIIFFLLSFGFYLQTKKRNWQSGALFGLAFAIKFFPLLLLFLFLLRRQWKVLFYSLGTFVALSVVAILLTGLPLQMFYLHSVLPGIGSSYQNAYYNQAFSGFFARLQIASSEGLFFKNILSLVLLIITFCVLYKHREEKNLADLSFVTVITLSLLINPFSWQHHFVWLIFPFLVTYYAISKRGVLLQIILAISFILVAANLAKPTVFPLLFQSHVLFGTMLLWLLQILLLHKKG